MEKPNLSYIESMSGGDKAFEQKLIDIIKKEFPEEIYKALTDLMWILRKNPRKLIQEENATLKLLF